MPRLRHCPARLRALAAAVALVLATVPALPGTAAAEDLHCESVHTYSSSLVSQARARTATGSDGIAVQDATDNVTVNHYGWITGNESVGEIRLAIIRVSFPAAADGSEDAMTIPASQSPEKLMTQFNGGGDTGLPYPYEDLHDYYYRASYGKLDIAAVTVVDYKAKHNRSYYSAEKGDESDSKMSELFHEALAGVDDQVDFSQCDANRDGYIDGVYLEFAGSFEGWDSSWWPSMHPLASESDQATYDGKKLCNGVIFGTDEAANEANFDMGTVLIHESGHAIGLPDLYTYGNSLDPKLGLGVFSMMNNSVGDIDAFSKFMLGWIDPQDVTYVQVTDAGLNVRRAGSDEVEHVDGDAEVALAALEQESWDDHPGFLAVSADPCIVQGDLFCDFYLVHHAKHAFNDAIDAGEEPLGHGFRVFRVQGELDDDGMFVYDNTTEVYHGQLMEGLTLAGGPWEYGRLWDAGAKITPTTTPSTNMRESLANGYTGIALSMDTDTGDGGTVSVSYAARPAADDPSKPGSGDDTGGTGAGTGTGSGATAGKDAGNAAGTSAKASVAAVRSAKGALANTGDRTLAVVAIVAGLGIIVIVAGVILVRRRR